ncbi:MAG: hypothetical protein ACRCZF_21580 [Gemmataceae bacterium]
MTEMLLVMTIVAAALVYLARAMLQTWLGESKSACGSCGSCKAAAPQEKPDPDNSRRIPLSQVGSVTSGSAR